MNTPSKVALAHQIRRTRRTPRGFTIVETLIVLAVTGGMLVSAIVLVAGQQTKVQFAQSAQDIQQRIQQTINEVGAGYYPNAGNFRCDGTGNSLVIATGNRAKGTNTGCIFLGKVMQFGIAGTDPQQFAVHSVAALQDNDGTLAGAKPLAIAPGLTTNNSLNFPSASTVDPLLYGLKAVSMKYVQGGSPQDISAMALLTGLGEYDADDQLVSGSQQVGLYAIGGTGGAPFGKSTAQVVDAVNTRLTNAAQSPRITTGHVEICFASGTGRQSALVTIGGNGRTLTVQSAIKSNGSCT